VPTKPITAEIKINGPGSAAPMVAEVMAVRRNKKIKYHERTEMDCALGKKANRQSVWIRLTASTVASQVSERNAAATIRNKNLPSTPQLTSKNRLCTTANS
jgi:hypothetical protein